MSYAKGQQIRSVCVVSYAKGRQIRSECVVSYAKGQQIRAREKCVWTIGLSL